MYEFDVTSQTLKLLTPNGSGGAGPNVTGVVAISSDGDKVYYVIGDDRLELFDGDSTRTVGVGTGISSKLLGNSPGNLSETVRQARVSPDGRQLLFATPAQITAFDNHGFREVYLYDAPTGQLDCLSCNRTGQPPLGDSDLKPDDQGSSMVPRNFVEDGTVLFESEDKLVPQDTNAAMDVYAWRNGALQLISDGRVQSGSFFIDASSNGRDIFFSTTASLLATDTDNGGIDIYDARVGGGFPEPPSPPRPCEGDQCQGLPRRRLPTASRRARVTWARATSQTRDAGPSAGSRSRSRSGSEARRSY